MTSSVRAVRTRVLFKDHHLILAGAILFGLGLVAVNAIWPSAFVVLIAVGGVLGAFMVLYEVRLTKRLAQAEFIRDLQSDFTSNPNIGELWRKLLLKEEVTAADRHLVSSYLTFFETLNLLIDRGVLDFKVTDDLFRNRFFTAVGDPGVLSCALASQAGAFTNIHHLISVWHDHLLSERIPMHPGYYRYIWAMTEAKGYEIRQLDASDLDDMLDLQHQVLEGLGRNDWLRANSAEMLAACLNDQVTVGVRCEGRLVAAGVLYDAGTTPEAVKGYISDDPVAIGSSINLKLVLALPEHRRAGLGRTLVELLEARALDQGKSEILCTVHERNSPSATLFESLGYRRAGSAATEYGPRVVFARTLPAVDRRWAR